MASIWEQSAAQKGSSSHPGSWGIGDFKLPDYSITENIQKVFNALGGHAQNSSQGGSNLFGGNQAAASTSSQTPVAVDTGKVQGPSLPPNWNSMNDAQKNDYAKSTGKTGTSDLLDSIKNAQTSQQDAAAAAAEAKRQAALRKYEAQKQIASDAKNSAKGQYDWLIDTLGTNKKDLLEQVTTNETQGLQNYADQETKTKTQYDSAKQEILNTYRELSKEQEKIMRGSGQGQSSRSQEATLRLNNLLGKDMSTVTTNEADSLALIGNALTAFKTATLQTKNKIESDTKSKLDKAALDYNDQIKAIDNNLMLSANEREDAYAEAETKLAADTANINSWAAGLKLQAEQTQAALKGQFDDYIVSMTDANGLLNSNLSDKTAATNDIMKAAGLTTMDTETTDTVNQGTGGKTSSKNFSSKEELDASGLQQSDPMEYQRQLNLIQSNGSNNTLTASAVLPQTQTTPALKTRQGNTMTTSVQNDPLLSALFA